MRDVGAELGARSEGVSLEDHRALRDLSERYAAAVDRRSAPDLVALFGPAARLATYYLPDRTPEREFTGHDELARIPVGLATYDRTSHFVGQSRYAYDGGADAALGEVYCQAHHLERDRHGGADYVMHIRYQDRYAKVDGRWRFEERELAVDWTTRHLVNPASFRREART